jgi:hypothetical protein
MLSDLKIIVKRRTKKRANPLPSTLRLGPPSGTIPERCPAQHPVSLATYSNL